MSRVPQKRRIHSALLSDGVTFRVEILQAHYGSSEGVWKGAFDTDGGLRGLLLLELDERIAER
jgi:hypothetical protein